MKLLSWVHLRNIYNSTGAGRVGRSLTEHLARKDGVQLHVLADPGDYQTAVREAGPPWTEFTYHFIGSETSVQQARWLLTGSPKAESYWPEADVVHCTAESYVPTKRARLAVTVHDAAYFDKGAHPRNFAVMKQQMKWRYLYATLSRKADLFHTVSHFSAERIARFRPDIRRRLRVVHNGVPDRFFAPVSPGGEEYVSRAGLAERPYVMLPRGLHYRKNADLVLEAWPRLQERNPELLLVVTSHCEATYAERAAALGDSVRMLGFVDDEALCSLYHRARVVWFPSRYEGFGLPALESMACGTPVVASNSSSLPEVCGDAAVLVDPQNPGEHIDAIETLLSNAKVGEDYRVKGLIRARQFSWSSAASQLHREFQALL